MAKLKVRYCNLTFRKILCRRSIDIKVESVFPAYFVPQEPFPIALLMDNLD